VGKALRGGTQNGGRRGGALGREAGRGWRQAIFILAISAACLLPPAASRAQDPPERLDRGRFTVLYYSHDRQLAASLATHALATDTFPGLPRPSERVVIAIAPDKRRFREWAGGAPEWGSAIAFPESHRVVLQGRSAGSDAGDPLLVLRHELAHLALHEYLGDLPPRWFDEGYASYVAAEWDREDVLTTNLALALGGMPTLEELEKSFAGGATAAQSAYALAFRAVAEMAQLDKQHGLALFLNYWRADRSLERAMRQAYGMTVADFERHWRKRTRQQYGGLALVSNLTLAALLLLFILTPLYVARRRRDRRRLETMRAADVAVEQAERQSVIDALLADAGKHKGERTNGDQR
jgi:hypothetical protein